MRRKIGLVTATVAAALVAASPLAFAGSVDRPAPSDKGTYHKDKGDKGDKGRDCPTGLVGEVAGEAANEIADASETAGAVEGRIESCGPLVVID